MDKDTAPLGWVGAFVRLARRRRRASLECFTKTQWLTIRGSVAAYSF